MNRKQSLYKTYQNFKLIAEGDALAVPALIVEDPHLHAEVDVSVAVVARFGLVVELGTDQLQLAVGHVVLHHLRLVPQLLHLVLQLPDRRRRLAQLKMFQR